MIWRTVSEELFLLLSYACKYLKTKTKTKKKIPPPKVVVIKQTRESKKMLPASWGGPEEANQSIMLWVTLSPLPPLLCTLQFQSALFFFGRANPFELKGGGDKVTSEVATPQCSPPAVLC